MDKARIKVVIFFLCIGVNLPNATAQNIGLFSGLSVGASQFALQQTQLVYQTNPYKYRQSAFQPSANFYLGFQKQFFTILLSAEMQQQSWVELNDIELPSHLFIRERYFNRTLSGISLEAGKQLCKKNKFDFNVLCGFAFHQANYLSDRSYVSDGSLAWDTITRLKREKYMLSLKNSIMCKYQFRSHWGINAQIVLHSVLRTQKPNRDWGNNALVYFPAWAGVQLGVHYNFKLKK